MFAAVTEQLAAKILAIEHGDAPITQRRRAHRRQRESRNVFAEWPLSQPARRDDLEMKIMEVGMNSLSHGSLRLTAAPLAVVCAVGTIFLASAQPLPTLDPEICASPTADVGAEASFLAENVAAMKKMMDDMAVKPTGDVDADFVAMTVPHHQGAIDMALAVLRHGRNPQIKRLAQEIIVTQQQEIAVMRLVVGQPLPPSGGVTRAAERFQSIGCSSYGAVI